MSGVINIGPVDSRDNSRVISRFDAVGGKRDENSLFSSAFNVNTNEANIYKNSFFIKNGTYFVRKQTEPYTRLDLLSDLRAVLPCQGL